MPIILSVSLLAVRMGHGAPPRQLKRKLHCVCNQTRRAILTGPCSIHLSSFQLPPIYLYITIKLLPFCNPYPAKRSPMPYSHIFFSLPLSSSNASIKRFGWNRRDCCTTVFEVNATMGQSISPLAEARVLVVRVHCQLD